MPRIVHVADKSYLTIPWTGGLHFCVAVAALGCSHWFTHFSDTPGQSADQVKGNPHMLLINTSADLPADHKQYKWVTFCDSWVSAEEKQCPFTEEGLVPEQWPTAGQTHISKPLVKGKYIRRVMDYCIYYRRINERKPHKSSIVCMWGGIVTDQDSLNTNPITLHQIS